VSAMTGGVEDEVRYGVDAGVATITIDRPARRNALSWPVVAELRRRIAEAREDDAVRVVVLTGAGEQAFCAGADLEIFDLKRHGSRTYDVARGGSRPISHAPSSHPATASRSTSAAMRDSGCRPSACDTSCRRDESQ